MSFSANRPAESGPIHPFNDNLWSLIPSLTFHSSCGGEARTRKGELLHMLVSVRAAERRQNIMTAEAMHNRQMSAASTCGTTRYLYSEMETIGPRRRRTRPSCLILWNSEKGASSQLGSSSFSSVHLRLLFLALACSCCWTTGVAGASASSFSHHDHDQRIDNQKKNSSNRSSSFIRKGDLPETGTQWVSLHEAVEFLPASTDMMKSESLMNWLGDVAGVSGSATAPHTFGTGQLNRAARQRKLDDEDEDEDQAETDKNRENNPQYRVQPFVEGVSDYDEYQQAWRLLGFMIDCDGTYMNADDDGGSGSEDENDTGSGCARYVIWAAVS